MTTDRIFKAKRGVDLLKELGYTLEDTQKLLPGIKPNDIGGPQLYDRERALEDVGITLDDGWSYQVTPDTSAPLGWRESLIDPDGNEATDFTPDADNPQLEIPTRFRLDDGTEVSQAELEELAVQAGISGAGPTELTEADMRTTAQAEAENQQALFEDAWAGVFQPTEQEGTHAKTQPITLEQLALAWETREQTRLGVRGEQAGDVQLDLPDAEKTIDTFLDTIIRAGRTPQTEAIWRAMGVSDAQLDEFYPGQKPKINDVLKWQDKVNPPTSTSAPIFWNSPENQKARTENLLRGLGVTAEPNSPEYKLLTEDKLPRYVETAWEVLMQGVWTGEKLAGQSTKDFFLSVLPEFFLRPPKAFEYEKRGKEVPDFSNTIAGQLKQKAEASYEQSQAKFEEWTRENQLALPEPYLQASITEHPELLHDAKWWAYTIGSTLPMAITAIGTTIVVSELTGNPLLGMTAGASTFFPSQTQDMYEVLREAGADERQAASIAMPVGLLMSAVESIGDLPFLKAVSPQFMKLFRKEASKELAKATFKQLVKKGVKTFTQVEISETLEEIAQQTLQNLALKMVNENQDIFEGLDDTAIQALVASLPFAVVGGGAQLRASGADIKARAKEIAAGERGSIGRPATVLKKLTNLQENAKYIALKETALKVGFDLEAVEKIKQGDYFVSISVNSKADLNDFLKWESKVTASNEDLQKLAKTLDGKIVEQGNRGVLKAKKGGFLPFVSLADAEKFLQTGDTSLIATMVEAKGTPMTPEQRASGEAELRRLAIKEAKRKPLFDEIAALEAQDTELRSKEYARETTKQQETAIKKKRAAIADKIRAIRERLFNELLTPTAEPETSQQPPPSEPPVAEQPVLEQPEAPLTEGSLYQKEVELYKATKPGEQFQGAYITEDDFALARERVAQMADGQIVEEADGLQWKYEKTNDLFVDPTGQSDRMHKGSSNEGLNIAARSKDVAAPLAPPPGGQPASAPPPVPPVPPQGTPPVVPPPQSVVPPAVTPPVPPVPPSGAVPPTTPPAAGQPVPAVAPLPKGRSEIDRIIAQSTEQIRQRQPGSLKRLALKIPGVKQLLEFERPGLKMTGENEKVLVALVAENAAKADVSVWAMSSRFQLLTDLKKAFGKEAMRGGQAENVTFKGTPDQAANPITGTIKDIADNPELYTLTPEQEGVLVFMEARNDQLLEWVTDNYGAEIGRFTAKTGGAFLPNVDVSEDVVEYLGGETRAAATGRGKTRIWQTARERMAGRTPFKPELDVVKLIEGLDRFKASAAAGQTYRAALEGLTRDEAMQKTHPQLYDRMLALKKRLASLKGSAGTLERNLHNAITAFEASPKEDSDLATLRDELEKPLQSGPRAGYDAAAVRAEIDSIRAEIQALRPAWNNANLKPYVFVQEGIYRYFPSDTAKLITESRRDTNNPILNLIEKWRGQAFSGDFSPFAIQGQLGVLADPWGSLKAGVGMVRKGISERDLLRAVKIDALAQDIANNPVEWGEYASLMGRTLSGTPAEYAAGFLSKIPGFDKFTEATYITVTRTSFDLWRREAQHLIASGIPEVEAKVAAAEIASDVFPLVNPALQGQSPARSKFLRAMPTSYSFLRQPVSLIAEAATAYGKLATFQKLTPSEAMAARVVAVGGASTLALAATSAALSAMAAGKDDDEVLEAMWEAINPDPYNGNFASLIIGGKRIPLGGPYRAVFRAIWPQEVEGVPFPVPFAGIPRYLKNRITPAVSTQIDLLVNKDYSGRQIIKGDTFVEKLLRGLAYEFENILPLTVGSGAEALRQGEDYHEDILEQIMSQFMGVNLVTLDNTYLDRMQRQLGTQIGMITKPYTVNRPDIYDARNIWTDVVRVLKARTKVDLTKEDPIVQAIWNGYQVKLEIDKMPTKTLKELASDPFSDTSALSRRDNDLIRQYELAEDKKQFLKDHPEMTESKKEAWLRDNPKENGLLAAFGQAKVYTEAAYKEARRLIKELDIPESAVEGYLPPEAIAKPYFEYQDKLNEFSPGSAEVKLLGANNPKLFEFLGREPVTEPIKSLELKVKNRDFDAQYDAFGDKDDPAYIEDDKERKEAREAFMKENKDYAADLRRITAYSNKADDVTTEKWVERGTVTDEFGDSSNEAKLWLLDNPEVHKWALEKELLTDDGSDWNVPVLRIQVKNRDLQTEFDAFADAKSDSYIDDEDERADARDAWYNDPEHTERLAFRDDLRRIDMLRKGTTAKPVAEAVVEKHVEFMKLQDADGIGSTSAEAMLFRAENTEYEDFRTDKAIWGDDALDPVDRSQIPIWTITAMYRKQDDEYNAILERYPGSSKEQTEAIAQYLQGNTMYKTARREREAYGMGLSQANVPKWDEFNDLPDYGFWKERYRMNNAGFDAEVKASQKKSGGAIWADIDPAKSPSVQYDLIYEQYKDKFDAYENAQGTPAQRQEIRTAMLKEDSDFRDAKRAREAYGKFVPEDHIENYIRYYSILEADKPEDYPKGLPYYEDDFFLIENRDFYREVYLGILGNERRDFRKTPPTRALLAKWIDYNRIENNQSARDQYRIDNSDLDEWGVSVGIWTRTMSEKRRRKGQTSSELALEDISELNEAFDKRLEELRRETGVVR